MNFRADTVVQRSCTRDTAGEIRVYRSSFRGIYAPLSFAAHFAALLLLLSREGKGREESARVQKFHEDDCDYRPLRYRSDLEGNKEREREFCSRIFGSISFSQRDRARPTRTAFLPSGGAASLAMAALLFVLEERERDSGYSWFPRDELE